MKDKSDAELATLLKSSNAIAFRAIYDRYCEPLFHYICSRIASEATAEEMTQELFIRLWNARNDLKTQKTLKPYLFRMAHNLIIDHHRKQNVRMNYVVRQQNEINPEVSDDVELSLQIKLAIQCLPVKLQSVFTLHHMNGYRYDEIAAIENISKKTVENRMKKAIYLLQKALRTVR